MTGAQRKLAVAGRRMRLVHNERTKSSYSWNVASWSMASPTWGENIQRRQWEAGVIIVAWPAGCAVGTDGDESCQYVP